MQASLVNPPPAFIDLTAEESPDEFESTDENTYSPPSTPGTPEPGNKYWAPYVESIREEYPDPEYLSAALTRYLNSHLDHIRREQARHPGPYPPPGQP